MPKAAMNEDSFSESWEHKVWASWQITTIQAESESELVSDTANE
jgi:hypothetical protein